MTVNEAIENVKYYQEWRLEENTRLNARLSDKLPNGGFRVHGIKNSMQPTFENDTE